MIENFELCEFVDKLKLHALINSGLLKEGWTETDMKKKYKWFNTRHYKGEIETLTNYYNNLDENGMVKIIYTKNEIQGRHKLPNCLSLMKRIYRNYLLSETYYDFDMVNSCATILVYLGLKHRSKNIKEHERYINNRQEWFNKIKKEFKCDDKKAKEIMTSVTFGAELSFKDTQLRAYKNGLLFIQNELKETHLYDYVETQKSGLSWLAKLIQTIEDKIVVGLMKHIELNYPQLTYNKFCDTSNAIYELDGFKLSKENVDNFGGPDAVIGIINEWLIENSYNSISFINKSMDEKIDLESVAICETDNVDIESVESVAICETERPSPIAITQTFSPIIVTSEEKFMIPVEILHLGSNDISRFIAPKLSEIMKYSRILEIWIVYDERTHFWEKIKKPDATLSTFLQKATNYTRQYLVNKQTSILSSGKQSDPQIERDLRICSISYDNFAKKTDLSMIKDFLTTYICDDNFINILDNNTYQLTFQNGILDLKTMKFRNGLVKEDYLTKCIPCDYVKPSPEQVSDVRKKLLKICNNHNSHSEYYLSLIGYCLTGDAEREQIFGYFRGQSASNGKSVIFEVLEDIMPNYVKKAENKLFDATFDMKKELPSFYGKRLIWVNELSEQKKDADRLKAFADGTTYSFGRNYAIESEILKVLFKIIIVSNYSLNIKADNGIVRRFKLCQFNSKFDENYTEDNYEKLEFKKDKNFGTKLRNEYKMALIELLAQYGNHYWNNKNLKEYPIEWNEEASENMNDNNKFDVWFNENFTFDESELKEGEKGLFVGKQFMTDMLPTDLRNVKITDELKRMRLNFTYDKGRRYKTAKGIYVGFGLKKREVEANE